MVRQDSPQVGKLCMDQRETSIGKLAALFSGVTADEIDEVVDATKTRLTSEAEEARRNDLEKLFYGQIATLEDRGVPEQIVEIIRKERDAVLTKASGMTIRDGPFDGTQGKNIPFLPVIPRSFRSPYDLMAMVRNGSKVGYTYLNPTQISDVVDAPQEPYYIYDVKDDNANHGKSPEDAEKILKSQKRSPLTAAEVTALATHTDVLSRHNVWATGSRYESRYESATVVFVFLDDGGRPGLSWGHVNGLDDHWGSASCGSR